MPDPLVQVGDLTSERNATALHMQTSQAREASLTREIEHLKLQRENSELRARMAEQASSGSLRGGSVKGIPDDDYRRELKALKAIINITFNSITSNPGESRRSNTSTG